MLFFVVIVVFVLFVLFPELVDIAPSGQQTNKKAAYRVPISRFFVHFEQW